MLVLVLVFPIFVGALPEEKHGLYQTPSDPAVITVLQTLMAQNKLGTKTLGNALEMLPVYSVASHP